MITGLGQSSSCGEVESGNAAIEKPCLMTPGNTGQVHPQCSLEGVSEGSVNKFKAYYEQIV